ncbi:MAG: energy transducer TonB [Bryobacteraceae bacterium]|jgi:protein TonB
MFDAISVSQRSRKPWTVTLSFVGQGVLIGLAVLVPLVSTEALPHLRVLSELLPEPPAPAPAHRPQTAVKPVKPVPFEISRGVLSVPSQIPKNVVMIQDADFDPNVGNDVGVPGGLGNPAGSGNAVIDSLGRPTPLPDPPERAAAKQAAQLAPITRIKVGGKVQEGKLISGPRPVYPPLARTARISGVVRLQAVISRDGAIMDLRAISGHPLLIPAAISAVKQWLFQPTYLNGDPVEVATDIEVNFTLQH